MFGMLELLLGFWFAEEPGRDMLDGGVAWLRLFALRMEDGEGAVLPKGFDEAVGGPSC